MAGRGWHFSFPPVGFGISHPVLLFPCIMSVSNYNFEMIEMYLRLFLMQKGFVNFVFRSASHKLDYLNIHVPRVK